VNTASNVAQRTADQVVTVAGAAGQRTQELTEQASESFTFIAQSGTALTHDVQEAAAEYLGMLQERMRTNLEGVNALMHCRTWPHVLAVQATLLRGNLELTMMNGRRIAELSARIAERTAGATRIVAAHARRSPRRAA
jgi:hypothetical protein